MKVKESIKKVGAAAASTLMVGMTLGSAATLADFPGMFIADDGTPTAQVVVGSSGAVSDVVGAVNVAAALGQATVQTSEQTKTVEVSSQGNVGWNAQNGQVLDTTNDQLYFGEDVDKVRQVLTSDHLDLLSDTTFQTDDGSDITVEHYLQVGNNAIGFGKQNTDNTDPFLYVDMPAGNSVDAVDAGGESYLYELQANFEEALDFRETGDSDNNNVNENVVGQEVELFGDTFTIGEDSFTGDNTKQLVLFGSSQETTVQTGQSTTLTIDGSDYTFEAVAVTGPNTAAFNVGGELREKNEGDTFTVGGQTIRVDDIIQTSDSNSAGYITFSIGSQKVVLQDGEPVMTGKDESEIEGTQVNLKGNMVSTGDITTNDVQLSSIQVAVGAAESEDSYVQAGNSFQDPVFGGLSFRFGGLAPDASQGAGDNVGEVRFSTNGDDTATVSYTPDGEDSSSSLEWFHDSDPGNQNNDEILADSDGHQVVVEEGAAVTEDQYFTANAGGFSHIWEVTSVDADTSGTTVDLADGDEATIDLQDAVTGQSVTVNLDATAETGDLANDDDPEVYEGTEVIDGQTYHFEILDDDTGKVYISYGSGAGVDSGGNNALGVGSVKSVYAAQSTTSGAAVALTEDVSLGDSLSTSSAGTSNADSITYQLPSTESTDAKTLMLRTYTESGATDHHQYSLDGGSTWQAVSMSSGSATVEVTVGQVDYIVDVSTTDTTDADTTASMTVDEIAVSDDQTSASGSDIDDAAALAIEPENDAGHEQAYVVSPESDVDDNSGQVEVGGDGSIAYTGNHNGNAGYTPVTLNSDDNVDVGYDVWGTHTVENTDSQGSFTLHIPDQQAVAGAAFTGSGGSLSMGGGGSGSASVTYTGVTNMDMIGNMPDIAMTDSQVTQSTRQNSDLILVGGPAVNTLVADLASQGKTWTVQEWRNQHQDEALLQVVENAFSQGNHALIVAGHSADDTRAAARYLANYGAHQSTLKGKMQYTPSSQEAPR